jgi:hypothetical protein
MSKVPEEINKRQIVLEDGRYMIFYTIAPSHDLGPEEVPVAFPEATPDQPEEEN